MTMHRSLTMRGSLAMRGSLTEAVTQMLDLGIVRFDGTAGALELIGLVCSILLGFALGRYRRGR